MNKIFDSFDQDKLRRMLAIKSAYNAGNIDLETGRKRMREEVGRITAEEFAAAEQLHKEEDLDECLNEDVARMLDLFDGLLDTSLPELPSTHPIQAYREENCELIKLLDQAAALLKKGEFILNPWMELMEQILPYRVHYSRKQNQLYSALERHGFTRPSTTMWTYDDFNRDKMKAAYELLLKGEQSEFLKAFEELDFFLRDLIGKEEMVLYPTALRLIPSEEFETMRHGDQEIGFYRIMVAAPKEKNRTQPLPSSDSQKGLTEELLEVLAKHNALSKSSSCDEVLHVAEGRLTLEQINLLFRHMPVDLSYVDESELVKFYSDTSHRIFPRSSGVIGREVRNCHPPKSLHVVEEIIEKFRSGEKDRIEFWINKPDLFIYIIYTAVRDEKGNFRGVLEMMQDCTHIRALEGSRTLLVWENEEMDSEGPASSEETDGFSPASTSDTELLINKDTRLSQLLAAYPGLKDELLNISPKFKLLKTPMAKIMLPTATLGMMSERSGVPLEELCKKIHAYCISSK